MALLQSIEDKTYAANIKMLQHNVAELNETIKVQNELIKQLLETLKK